ncbi:hypothetical protein BDQ12DRAFT_643549 [Crucibulum laeve]|uniref:Uncharacterized protein n=1 Tax=Crucibulum laeve TaxID=68775 RepID=A0A5C3MEK8_9AGAR|nr:hypothetical protein BDQ12DRAFT_643549 [Crucibulum laeve]
MAYLTEGNGPSYISSHSADVILSDIRPIKLKIEALCCINVLLDEFLYSILSTACSLSTDKLRASLLSLLPTSLGKEALLEAEVELRAYWERTGHVGSTNPPTEDDTKTFHLHWAFELLRLKCEAYSTLNESDEDPGSETHINERMAQTHAYPPAPSLVAPAALYLTAVLEAMCEHILSNVARVAARDSSRTSATVNDLFVALCEDDSIYGLFKSMKVYEQIEVLSTAPKSRRSKSFSRSDRNSTSRTASPHQDLSLVGSTSNTRSRISSEGSTIPPPSNPSSRSSFDKTRAIKMFMVNNKASLDREGDSQSGHKRSDSAVSENTKHQAAFDDGERSFQEDVAMLQEFDDLMRSTSTMKVSLTPDRLKTMEVYKQEKDQRGNRHLVPLSLQSESFSAPSSRTTSQRPSLRHVDSIVEDDEEGSSPTSKARTRQVSVASPPSASLIGSASRTRSVSTSSASPHNGGRKPASRTNAVPPPSFSPTLPSSGSSSPAMMQNYGSRGMPKGFDGGNGFPTRTRVKQRNRESLDLDDVMGGSDDEEPSSPVKAPPRGSSRRRGGPPYAMSASTRELIDFLAEGPPDTNISKPARDMMDFLAEGPPQSFGSSNHNSSAISLESKPKGGRLQRMISKLNLGNAEKGKGGGEGGNLSRSGSTRPQPPPTPGRQTVHPKASVTTLSSLANRPIPPRMPLPRPISPPSSPSPSRGSFEEDSVRHQPRRPSVAETTGSTRTNPNHAAPLPSPPPVVASSPRREKSISRVPPPSHSNGSARNDHAREPSPESVSSTMQTKGEAPKPVYESRAATKATNNSPKPIAPKPSSPKSSTAPTRSLSVRKPVPALSTPPPSSPPSLSHADLLDMQRLISRATNTDECRLIVDMFVARAGLSAASRDADMDAPYPSPSPSLITRAQPAVVDDSLEHSLLELLLGGSVAPHLDLLQESLNAESEVHPTISQPIDGLPTTNELDTTQDTTSSAPIITQEHTLVSEVGA